MIAFASARILEVVARNSTDMAQQAVISHLPTSPKVYLDTDLSLERLALKRCYLKIAVVRSRSRAARRSCQIQPVPTML